LSISEHFYTNKYLSKSYDIFFVIDKYKLYMKIKYGFINRIKKNKKTIKICKGINIKISIFHY